MMDPKPSCPPWTETYGKVKPISVLPIPMLPSPTAMPSTGTDTPFAWSSVPSRTPSARWTMIRATISCKTPGATCPRIPTASAPPSATQVKKARERHSCSPQATRASSSASCVLPETRNAAHWPYPATARRWETGQLPPRSGCRRYAPTCGNWPWTPLSYPPPSNTNM